MPPNTSAVDHLAQDLDFAQISLGDKALADFVRRVTETPVSVRDALETFSPSADEYQREVIQSSAATIRLVAPAGSGKTQTLVNRVLHRIRQGVAPHRFLILTFDNSAAQSIKSKVAEETSQRNVDLTGFHILTLNAFGYGVLRREFHDERGVIQTPRQHVIMKQVLKELEAKSEDRFKLLPKKLKRSVYLELISVFKNKMFDPRSPDNERITAFLLESPTGRAFMGTTTDRAAITKIIQALIWIFQVYERALQKAKLMDFDDQKLRAYQSLRAEPAICRSIQTRFSEVIVDEFQDVNELDFALIKLIAAEATLVVTGDDDQAIYGFRGCTPEYIINLEQHLGRPVTSFELSINYRNPPNVLTHAVQLIGRNSWRIAKTPRASRTDTARIKVVNSVSPSFEAKFVASLIGKIMRGNPRLSYEDFAVLYRTNAQSLPLQVELLLADIPYYVRPQDSILKNEELGRLLGILRFKMALESGAKPDGMDTACLVAGYSRFPEGGLQRRVATIVDQMSDALRALESEAFFQVCPWARKGGFRSGVMEVLAAKDLSATLSVLAEKFHGMSSMVGSLEDMIDEGIPLGELFEIAVSFRGDTRAFVSTMQRALDRAREREVASPDDDGVKLLTYFRAKGLQWHTVILTTCNDGIIPHRRAPVEEERRLFYVAMTRASANLVLSHVRRSCSNKVDVSRFLREASLA